MATIAEEIALDLAKALASNILERVGVPGVLLNLLGLGSNNYFDATNYDKIQAIVKEELDANTIESVSGGTLVIVQWMKINYKGQKKRTKTKDEYRELVDLLRDEANDLNKLRGELIPEGRKKAGLGVYLILAGVHLGMLQELALIDPDAGTPLGSAYAEQVQKYANIHVKHANDTFELIVREELGKISRPKVVKRTIRNSAPVGEVGGPTFDSSFYVEKYFWENPKTKKDESTREYYISNGGIPQAKRNSIDAKYNAHKDGVIKKLRSTFGFPRKVASEWEKLAGQPVPK